VLLVDTAGRLAIDELMAEIKDLHATLKPVETLFVVDAMQGQDAVNTAKAFKEALPLTGIVLTKLDGDSRGGAALSVRQITGAPIKFAGVSEKIDGLEVFDADRHASACWAWATSWPWSSRSPRAWTWRPRRSWPRRSRAATAST
jgi:signal recognition particle subunit SRP54